MFAIIRVISNLHCFIEDWNGFGNKNINKSIFAVNVRRENFKSFTFRIK